MKHLWTAALSLSLAWTASAAADEPAWRPAPGASRTPATAASPTPLPATWRPAPTPPRPAPMPRVSFDQPVKLAAPIPTPPPAQSGLLHAVKKSDPVMPTWQEPLRLASMTEENAAPPRPGTPTADPSPDISIIEPPPPWPTVRTTPLPEAPRFEPPPPWPRSVVPTAVPLPEEVLPPPSPDHDEWPAPEAVAPVGPPASVWAPTVTLSPSVAAPPASYPECVAAEAVYEMPPPCLYFQAEYLLWFLDTRDAVPPLLGGDGRHQDRHGLRFGAGWWFNPSRSLAVEASGFFLTERAVRSFADPARVQGLFPAVSGSLQQVRVDAPNNLWGVEANGRARLWEHPFGRIDLLGGFRFLELEDALGLGVSQGSLMSTSEISTANRFYGGQLGTAAQLRCGRLTLDVTGKVGLGCTEQTIGSGGLLMVDGSAARTRRNLFGVVPEVGVTVGCQLTEALRVWAGYNLLLWSRVVRPGQQVEAARTAQAALRFNDSSFWAQGLNCGVELLH